MPTHASSSPESKQRGCRVYSRGDHGRSILGRLGDVRGESAVSPRWAGPSSSGTRSCGPHGPSPR
eukprot:2057042-Rhodomonas_salina.1